MEADPTAAGGRPRDLERWAHEAGRHTAVPALEAWPYSPARRDALRGIPARKWLQIQAFAGAALAALPPGVERVVDWCAGKSHLGRTVGLGSGLPVTAVERRRDLCATGAVLADRAGATCDFVCADVLTDESHPEAVFGPLTGAVGLHACGELSDRLLQRATDGGALGLVVSTCCYHRVPRDPRYPPRSALGRACDPGLDHSQLRLATADEVVARMPRRRARRRELAYRQAFDLLVREATGEDRFHSTGPIPRATFKAPFDRAVEDLSERSGLPLPARWDTESVLAEGAERARVARALGLVRTLFRRPLECWLVLDRAQALREAGWEHVHVGTFCAPSLTPRNLAIVARRRLRRAASACTRGG